MRRHVEHILVADAAASVWQRQAPWYQPAMALLKWLLVAAAIYGCALALIYFGQRSLQYHPDRSRVAPATAGLPAAEEIELKTADGETVIVWHVPPKGDRPVVLYFHGNGGSLAWRANRFKSFTADGTGLIALSYRGYGGSSGSPTEAGLIADAEAAYAFAAARYPVERIALWGESLGTGVAVALAASHEVSRLVLESPFTAAADVGAKVYWFLPVQLLMKDTFRSNERIGKISVPLLILHGTADAVVPFGFGQKLFALANEPKRFVGLDGGGHSNLDQFGAQKAIRAFLYDRE
jgi:pimeloyl-ACP methyl ester carboxylesterase